MHGTFADIKTDIQLIDLQIGFNGTAGITFQGKSATEKLCGMGRRMNCSGSCF